MPSSLSIVSVISQQSEISQQSNVTASGTLQINHPTDESEITLSRDGTLDLYRATTNDNSVIRVYTDIGSTKNEKFTVRSDGSADFAGNAAGITSAGELYFTSRGTRYKLVVAGGLVTPEPYTREMELREQAEALRKPRSTDSVSED